MKNLENERLNLLKQHVIHDFCDFLADTYEKIEKTGEEFPPRIADLIILSFLGHELVEENGTKALDDCVSRIKKERKKTKKKGGSK